MMLEYLLEMLDYLIEFEELMDYCLDSYDKEYVIRELVHFRKYGKLSDGYMSSAARGVFRLMLKELKMQIEEADPEWLETYKVKAEDRLEEAQIQEQERENRAAADAEAESEEDAGD